MFGGKEFKKDVYNSFNRVKQDIGSMRETIKDQNSELQRLKEKVFDLYGIITDLQSHIQSVETTKDVPQPPVLSAPKIEPQPVAPQKKFVVSLKSGKVHDRECFFAKQIRPHHRMLFNTKMDAINKGYSICSACS